MHTSLLYHLKTNEIKFYLLKSILFKIQLCIVQKLAQEIWAMLEEWLEVLRQSLEGLFAGVEKVDGNVSLKILNE